MRRYEALDSWRGVCAALVVVFHLNQSVASHLFGARFVGGFFLFVDFFFVLSGFVIAASYEERLKSGFGIVPFALRRFGRIYPLHFAMLAAMGAYAVARVLLPLNDFNPRAVFDGGIYDFTALFTNALLLHGIGFEHHLTWNYPSWSISAEFYTYLIFAAIWAFAARWSNWVTIALIVACPIVLASFTAPSLSVLDLVRCVCGFAAGVLVRHIYTRVGASFLPGKRTGAALEIAATLACALFVGFGAGAGWAAAIVFAFAVFVFAFEAGPISRLLRTKPFAALGTLSYSIYMVHAVLITIAWGGVTLLERNGWALTIANPVHAEGAAALLFGRTPWIGDIAVAVMLAAVAAVSAATYALIEKPGRSWGQDASQRWRERGWRGVFGPRAAAAQIQQRPAGEGGA